MLLAGAEDLPALPTSFVGEYMSFGGGAFGNVTYDPGLESFFKLQY